MIDIQERLLTISPYCRTGEKQNKIKNIIVHWVGNAGSSAIGNRNYFNSLATTHKTIASSHYIIGLNGEVIRCIPDDEVAFHSGSYTMNRQSIGIEVCHPDWEGKFNSATYSQLVAVCTYICKQYGLTVNDILRHYDVTGKCCPKYYVEHNDAWLQFKQDVQNKLMGTVKPIPVEQKGSEEKPMYKFKNGKTLEYIYADSNHTKQIGYLNKWEECDCYGIINGAPMVKYKVGNTNNFKVGFASDTRCVK